MKTRIMKLSDNEYVAQYWVPHFLFGGHWEGLQKLPDGSIYSFGGAEGILKHCVVSSNKQAEDLLKEYSIRVVKKELVTK